MRVAVHFNFAIELDGKKLLSRHSWDRLRQQIKQRDHAICYYCGVTDRKGSVDHIIPLSRGGTDDMVNLVWACRSCNSAKGDMTEREWDLVKAGFSREEVENGYVITPEYAKALLSGNATFSERGGKDTAGALQYGYSREQVRDMKHNLIDNGYAVDMGGTQGVRLNQRGRELLATIAAKQEFVQSTPLPHHERNNGDS